MKTIFLGLQPIVRMPHRRMSAVAARSIGTPMDHTRTPAITLCERSTFPFFRSRTL